MDALTQLLIIDNQYTEIERVNYQCNVFCRTHGIPDRTRRTLNMVLDEALNNIITYAFDKAEKHLISVLITYNAPEVMIELVDDGIPFNLLEAKEPDVRASVEEREIGGLGILLIRKTMDSVRYERKNNRNHTTLIKYIDFSTKR